MSLPKELEEQLKVQRDKLLDLSGRNSLIDFKFKVKENARSQNYLRIVDEVPELIIDKLNVDKRFEVIPNKKDKEIRGIAKILDILKPIFDLFLIHITKDNIFYFLTKSANRII